MPNTPAPSKNTPAFFAQAGVSFAVSLLGLLFALLYLPVDPWVRAFLAMTTLYLVSSSFTLAKVIRDRQEDDMVFSRLDQARLEKALATHDPYKNVAS